MIVRALHRLDPPGPHGSAAEITTLRVAARRFVRHPRPPVLLACVAALAVARAARGRPGRRDLSVAAACLTAQPFVEWGVHRGLLHARPTGRLGELGYRLAGWGHEQHHRDPTSLDTMFLRPQEVLGGTAVALTVSALASPATATGMLCVGLGALAYDWTHFLIHTSVRPRSRYYRRIWRGHRLHHYRNEGYWLGVTGTLGDVVFGTNPPRDAVGVSPTARGLSRGVRTAGRPLSAR
jgi:Fatty acid hydroxylase superfamily